MSATTTASVDSLLSCHTTTESLLNYVLEECPHREQEVIAALKRRLAWSCKEGEALSRHLRAMDEDYSSRIKSKTRIQAGLTLIGSEIKVFWDGEFKKCIIFDAGIDLNGAYVAVKYKEDKRVEPRLNLSEYMWKLVDYDVDTVKRPEGDTDETESECESNNLNTMKKRKRMCIESESESETGNCTTTEDLESTSSSNSSTITSDSTKAKFNLLSTDNVVAAWLGSHEPNCSAFLSAVGGKAFKLASCRWEVMVSSSVFMKETLLMICRGKSGISNADDTWCQAECIVCKRSRNCRKVFIKDVFSEPVLVGKTCLDRLNASRAMFTAWQSLAQNPCTLPKTDTELECLTKTASKATKDFNESLRLVDESLGMDKAYQRHPSHGWGYF